MTRGRLAACVVLLTVMVTVPVLAQRKPAPPDPDTANADVRAGTQGLDAEANARWNQLDRISRDVSKLKPQAATANKKADDAAAAAEAVRVAANRCVTEADKQKIQKQLEEAKKKLEDAQKEKDKLGKMEKDIRDRVKQTLDGMNQRISDLQKEIDAGIQAAKGQGYKDNSAMMSKLNGAKAGLDAKVSKLKDEGTKEKNYQDEGGMSKLERAANSFNPKIREAKGNKDPKDALDEAARKLKEAEEALKNCPKTTGMMIAPQQPQEVFIAVDNRPQALVCIADGQNVDQATNTLGITESEVVASTPGGGTVVRTPSDPKTIDKTAAEKGVKLCFPTEGDFCTIMTPLTPFRGHDHAAHLRSGRGVHDHDGPNPPLTWGVTPPTPVIRLAPRR